MSTFIFIYMPSRQKENTDKTKVLAIGEEQAFDYFFRQYYTALCYFANTIIHDEDEAKDIVQECFIKLWDGQTISERKDTVKSFLYTAVRNKCVDVLRRKKTMQKVKVEISKNEAEPEFFDEIAFAEMVRLLSDRLAELPSKVQQIIKLYYVDGKKYHEIADELKSTPEAVRKQKIRALQSIRKKFNFFSFLMLIFISYSI